MQTQPMLRSNHPIAHTSLSGHPLLAARILCGVGILLALGVFGASLPFSFYTALTTSSSLQLGGGQLGFSGPAIAIFRAVIDCVTVLVFLSAAVLLLARRTRSWLILFLSSTLVLAGVNYTDAFFAFYVRVWPPSVPAAVVGLTSALAEICQLAAFLVFPDGRFAPRWLGWLLVVWIPYRILAWIVAYPLGMSGTSLLIDLSIQLAFFGTGIAGQIYRDRRAKTLAHRQQTRWIIFGLSAAVLTLILYVGIGVSIRALPVPGAVRLIYIVAGTSIYRVALWFVPVSVTVSILRYRLWDIDFFINRSLVYGGVMVLMGSVLVGVFLATQTLLDLMVKNMQAGAAGIISLIVVIALFLPLRNRLQRFVDSRFYGVNLSHERAVQEAIARERDHLSHELHDSVTQSLYGLAIMAESCQRLVCDDDAENLEEPLAEMGDVARQALKEMRLLIYELRPPLLEEKGLPSALHHRLATVERQSGIEASLVLEEIVDLPVMTEEAFYHIAIEALNNAIKHAAATSVRLSLRTGDTGVEMEIADDGKGFDPSSNVSKGGLGLPSMRKRADELGGTLTIHSMPGEGTRVVARIPYRADDRKHGAKVMS